MQITESRDEGYQGVVWTPDGRLVFGSKVGGDTNIWVMDADWGDRKRLTDSAGTDAWPSVSPDGRYVAFQFPPGGRAGRLAGGDRRRRARLADFLIGTVIIGVVYSTRKRPAPPPQQPPTVNPRGGKL